MVENSGYNIDVQLFTGYNKIRCAHTQPFAYFPTILFYGVEFCYN